MDNKKNNFKRVAENRVNKIIKLISSLANLSNTSFYEYTDEQIDAIFNAIEEETHKTKSKFDKSKKRGKKFKL